MTDLSPSSLQLIQTKTALTELISTLDNEQILCLDTEFHSENRYTPKLMLLQLADLKRNTWIIDPLKLDITPLADSLKNKKLILHGCTEDLRILQRRLFSPACIFDTQIAAALLGIYYPTSLNGLIKKCFNIEDVHQQTLSDWSRRPLSEGQLTYAAHDVSCLGPLFLYFQEKLQSRQNQLETICAEFAHDVLHPTCSKDWLSWGITKTLSATSIKILHELLSWREQQAQRQNKPVNYILPRKIAIDIAKRHPESIQSLRKNRRMSGVLIKHHGNSLLQCVQRGKSSSLHFTPLSTERIRFADVIRTWSLALSHQVEIDSNLLLPHSLALQIAGEGVDVLKGWRRELLLQPLQNFLSGETQLFIDQKRLCIK